MTTAPSPSLEYSKPIAERISAHTTPTGDYQKSVKRVILQQTGVSLKTNEVPFLIILDVDINKQLDLDRKQELYQELFDRFKGRGARIVRTAHNGLHIYCNQGDFELASNREIKCYSCPDFDLDLFGCQNPAKKSMVLLPGSQIRDGTGEPILNYEIVDDPPDGVLTLEIGDALSMLGIQLEPVVEGKKGKVRPTSGPK